MASHFLHPTEGIGQIIGVSDGNLTATTNGAVAIPLNISLEGANIRQGLVRSIHIENSNCLVEPGDRITFWDEGNTKSEAYQTYINVAGKCVNCKNPCPFSINSLSEQAKLLDVHTKRIGKKQDMSRKEFQSIEIGDNGDVKTTPTQFFEI